MKIAIITCTTENRKWIYDITNPSKQKYCESHGYNYIFSNNFYPDRSKSVYWLKPAFIAENISADYDWILWCDDDAGIIDQNFDLEKFIETVQEEDKLVYAAEDLTGINAGVLLVKSCEMSKQLFKFIFEKLEPIFKTSRFEDQDALIAITSKMNNLKLIDGKIINAYDPRITISPKNQRTADSYILHIAGGTPLKLLKFKLIQEIFKCR